MLIGGPRADAGASSLSRDPAWASSLQSQAHPKPTGVSGVTIYWGQVVGEEDNPEVLREKWFGDGTAPGIADQMVRTDPHVRASMSTIIYPITQAIWDARHDAREVGDFGGELTPAQLEHARFVRWNLFAMLAFDRYVRQALGYLKNGHSLFELLTDIVEVPAELFPHHPSPEVNGKKRVLMFTGIRERLPRTIYKWHMDSVDPDRVTAIDQRIFRDDTTPKSGKREMHRRLDFVRSTGAPAVIRHSFDQIGNDPEGFAQLRSIFFAWKSKRALRLLDAIRHERQNLGVPTLGLPPGFNKEDEKKAKAILEALRGHERAYIVLPNGFTFQWNVSGQGQGTDVQKAIEYCDREIWMNVLAPFMLLGGNGDTGSYALAETMNDVRLLGLEAHVRLLCEPWNIGVDTQALLPWLVRANYGEQVIYPKLTAVNLPTRDWSKIVPQVLDAISVKAIDPDEALQAFLRQVLYLPQADLRTRRIDDAAVQTSARERREEREKKEATRG